ACYWERKFISLAGKRSKDIQNDLRDCDLVFGSQLRLLRHHDLDAELSCQGTWLQPRKVCPLDREYSCGHGFWHLGARSRSRPDWEKANLYLISNWLSSDGLLVFTSYRPAYTSLDGRHYGDVCERNARRTWRTNVRSVSYSSPRNGAE